MTGRNPDGTEGFPLPDCSDVAYGPQRLNTIIGAYEHFLDRARGTDDLSFHLVPELPAAETPPVVPEWETRGVWELDAGCLGVRRGVSGGSTRGSPGCKRGVMPMAERPAKLVR